MTNTKELIRTEEGWCFDNSYTRLPNSFFSRTNPVPVRDAKLVILNHSLAAFLGFNIEVLQSQNGIDILAGNQIPEGALPISQAYAGHQFGHFTMLGDGRAVLIGEQITPQGERYDIQLKGSGRTPFSRGGDGRATLGPMLREYIISEAMYGLGIPTTRSLAVVLTGESVIRETQLPGAILTRVAASHLRFGTFEYIAKWGTIEELRTLADYAIKRHFSYIEREENPYLSLLREVIKGQASLIAKWQLVGFIHGVMNTDNMTISGETIDYGPCAFMDVYNPETVFSSIDRQGRYAFGNQPHIAGWNIARFAETLLPLIHNNKEHAIELAQGEISNYSQVCNRHRIEGMRGKLGLINEEKQDESLIENLLHVMEKHQVDYTNTFRELTLNELDDTDFYHSPEFVKWYETWQARLHRQQESKDSIQQIMRNSNPAVIPRNHRVEAALEAAVKRDDYSIMKQLLDVLSNPYGYTTKQDEYATPPDPSTPYRTFCGT